MTAPLIDLMASLTTVIEDEAAAIGHHANSTMLRDLVEIKQRLTGLLERELARLTRLDPHWVSALDGEDRAAAVAALDRLTAASDAGAVLVRRRLDMTGELIGALGDEARRVAGRRASTYDGDGDLTPPDAAPPISFSLNY